MGKYQCIGDLPIEFFEKSKKSDPGFGDKLTVKDVIGIKPPAHQKIDKEIVINQFKVKYTHTFVCFYRGGRTYTQIIKGIVYKNKLLKEFDNIITAYYGDGNEKSAENFEFVKGLCGEWGKR